MVLYAKCSTYKTLEQFLKGSFLDRKLTFYLENQRFMDTKNIFECIVKVSLHSFNHVKGNNLKAKGKHRHFDTNRCLFWKMYYVLSMYCSVHYVLSSVLKCIAVYYVLSSVLQCIENVLFVIWTRVPAFQSDQCDHQNSCTGPRAQKIRSGYEHEEPIKRT